MFIRLRRGVWSYPCAVAHWTCLDGRTSCRSKAFFQLQVSVSRFCNFYTYFQQLHPWFPRQSQCGQSHQKHHCASCKFCCRASSAPSSGTRWYLCYTSFKCMRRHRVPSVLSIRDCRGHILFCVFLLVTDFAILTYRKWLGLVKITSWMEQIGQLTLDPLLGQCLGPHPPVCNHMRTLLIISIGSLTTSIYVEEWILWLSFSFLADRYNYYYFHFRFAAN